MTTAVRNILSSLIVLVCTLALLALTLELYVRFVEDDGMQFDIEMQRYALLGKRISNNPQVGHAHQPGAKALLMGADVSINSTGFRDREFTQEPAPGKLRIMMIGDSLTFGWGVPQDRTTPKVLERILRSHGVDAEVINAGVGNYNTVMEVESFFEVGQRFRPSIVILNYFINDAEPIPHYQPVNPASYSKAWVFITSRLDSLERRWGVRGRDTWDVYYRRLYDDAANPGGWNAAKSAMQRLADYSKQRGIAFYIVNYPELRQLSPYPFVNESELVRGQANALGVPYLDLLHAVHNEKPEKLWVTPPDPHPNEKACALFAKAIADWLLKSGYVNTKAADQRDPAR